MPLVNLKNNLLCLLQDYKKQIDDLIESQYSGSSEKLSQAALYALRGSGKRFRPCITLIVADLLKKGLDASYGALAIELFHTASLIADDLPSMDDDDKRREKASLHKKYGEGVALLTSYALIGEGYCCVLKNKKMLKGKLDELEKRSEIALQMLSHNNGINGAPSGQLLDLYPPSFSQEDLDLIFYRKTVLFFETAFALGWLFGGGELAELETVKSAANHFGMAFQIYDDFCDLEQDRKKGKKINYPLSLGIEKSREFLKRHVDECERTLKNLSIYGEHFQEMLSLIKSPLKL